ncbi:MAG: ABC transporter ATP-binding protein [Candidatus Aminicenantes bacterium]|nr:ABC transporter ATP-binding protein [Candidatus Aminicenantes bacterium]
METTIELNGLNFSYGDIKAVDNVSLNTKKGIYGLLGPNGAGKTTLMKLILGFLKAQSGNGKVLGYGIEENRRELREQVGYMSESDSLIPGMDAVDFTSYLGRLSGMPKQEAIKRAHEVLYYVGLEESRYRKIETYSSGMMQRLKLASSIVHDPVLLFLDEPTSGMDPGSRKEMIELINDISRKGTMSIIISSHILPDIEATCEDVIIMDKGKIIANEKISVIASKEIDIFEIKLGRNSSGFLKKFQKFKYEEGERGVIRMQLPSDFSTKEIFDAALESGTHIKHFLKRKSTLEDTFMNAIGENGAN